MRSGNKKFYEFKLLESVKFHRLHSYIVKRTTADNAFGICKSVFS